MHGRVGELRRVYGSKGGKDGNLFAALERLARIGFHVRAPSTRGHHANSHSERGTMIGGLNFSRNL